MSFHVPGFAGTTWTLYNRQITPGECLLDLEHWMNTGWDVLHSLIGQNGFVLGHSAKVKDKIGQWLGNPRHL